MIAPASQTDGRPPSRGLRYARRLVASTLLRRRLPGWGNSAKIAAWKAWLFTAWVVVVTAVYGAYMLGWW
jgi:hypothetical protein